MAFDPVTAVFNLIDKGVDRFFPPKMSEEEKEKLKADMKMFAATESRQENTEFRNFVLQYEGSAKDYANIPLIGPLMMLIRGVVRPAFTYGTFYFDWLYFTNVAVDWSPERAKLLAIINVIVLCFWFGEKILVNTGLMDVLLKVFVGKNEKGT